MNLVNTIVENDGVVLEVTMKCLYVFHPRPDNRSAKQIVKEFFHDNNINSHHVARDVCEVANSKVITKIKILKKGDKTAIEQHIYRS